MHLMTQEAFTLYDYHVKQEGVLAVHIAANHIDLAPVVKGLARTIGRKPYRIKNWIILIRDNPLIQADTSDFATMQNVSEIIWTDDHSNLLQVLR